MPNFSNLVNKPVGNTGFATLICKKTSSCNS